MTLTRARFLLLPLAALVALSGAACASSSKKKKDYPESFVRFALEAGPHETGTQTTLPKSGVSLVVTPKFHFTEFDIQKCEAATDELGPVLVFTFTEQATRDLYRFSVTNQGKRVVTVLNSQAIGARRLNGTLGTGHFITNVELEPAQLETLAKNITRTSEDARKEMEKNK